MDSNVEGNVDYYWTQHWTIPSVKLMHTIHVTSKGRKWNPVLIKWWNRPIWHCPASAIHYHKQTILTEIMWKVHYSQVAQQASNAQVQWKQKCKFRNNSPFIKLQDSRGGRVLHNYWPWNGWSNHSVWAIRRKWISVHVHHSHHLVQIRRRTTCLRSVGEGRGGGVQD